MYASLLVLVDARKDTTSAAVISKQWHIAHVIASRTTSA